MQSFNERIIDKVLLKLEENLGYVTIDELIAYSGFSYYHFHRLFAAYTGETLARYIKRMRLEKAARHLNYDERPVTEVAAMSGFNTPSAFNKAFRSFFGCSPRDFKSAHIQRQRPAAIPPQRFETLAPVAVYALRHVGAYGNALSAYAQLMQFITAQTDKYVEYLAQQQAYIYAVAYDDPNVTSVNKLRADVCISAIEELTLAHGIEHKYIAGGKYGIFIHQGAYGKLYETFEGIYQWLLQSDMRLRDAPNYEKYLIADPQNRSLDALTIEIHIPLSH